MKIYKITESINYLGVSINTLKTLANNGKRKLQVRFTMLYKILEIAMLLIISGALMCLSAIAAGVIREALDEMREEREE